MAADSASALPAALVDAARAFDSTSPRWAAIRRADRAVGAAFWRRRGARRVQCAAASARPAFTSPKGSSPPLSPCHEKVL